MISSVVSGISNVACAVYHGITYILTVATETAGTSLLSLLFTAVDGLTSLALFLLDTVLDLALSAATSAGDFLAELAPGVAIGMFDAGMEVVRKVGELLKEMTNLIIWTVWETIKDVFCFIWSFCYEGFLFVFQRVKRD